MTVDIDCRGMPCPRPIIELALAFPEVAVGESVRVVADDVAAEADLKAWCRLRGQEYVGRELADDGVPAYVIRRIS